MSFADEVERAQRQREIETAADVERRHREEETARRNAAAVRRLGEEVRDALVSANVPPARGETLTWTKGGGKLSPTRRFSAEVPRGWRLGENDGWSPLVTPDGVLHSSWVGPTGRDQTMRHYSRPLAIGSQVHDGDFWQQGWYILNRDDRIILHGDSETGDTDLRDQLARAVARLLA